MAEIKGEWEQYEPNRLCLPRTDKLGKHLDKLSEIIDVKYIRKKITENLLAEIAFVFDEMLYKEYPNDINLQIIVGTAANHFVIFPGNDYTRDNYFREPTEQEIKKFKNEHN